MQRFHHWQRQAVVAGHSVHVFTGPSPFGRGWLSTDKEISPVHRMPRNYLESLNVRWGPRRRTWAIDAHQRRFDLFIQSQVIDRCGVDFDVVIYSSVPSCRFQRKHSRGVLIYDCLDEWSGFESTPEDIGTRELAIARQADLVFAVSKPLVTRLAHEVGPDKVVLIPNACDYDFFATAASATRKTPDGVVRVGYTGSILHWFNWEAVYAIACALPKSKIELIGPYDNVPPALPGNIRLLGRQPYSSLPHFVSGFDVCIIPFCEQDSLLIQSVSPIKLYEYLAAGKPVVSSPMPDALELAAEGIVHLARSPGEFVSQIHSALTVKDDPTLIARRQRIAQENSWSSRWQQIESCLPGYVKDGNRA